MKKLVLATLLLSIFLVGCSKEASITTTEVITTEEITTEEVPTTEEVTTEEITTEEETTDDSDEYTRELTEEAIKNTIRDMKKYDYINDVGIAIEDGTINIAICVPSSLTKEAAQSAGEDVIRYLAAQASFTADFDQPTKDTLGTLYDSYGLLIMIYDNAKSFEYWGSKGEYAANLHWGK